MLIKMRKLLVRLIYDVASRMAITRQMAMTATSPAEVWLSKLIIDI